ncbi:hypothetical protein E4T56_gene15805, partial [Termitomyces sp. T112]
MSARFRRLVETGRPPVALTIDGLGVTAMEGDTLMVAMLTHGNALRSRLLGLDRPGRASARLFDAGTERHGYFDPAAGGDMGQSRVIIIGAGPAGVRAAATVVRAGLRPIVLDEAARAGGQIYRRPPENFTRSHEELYGTEAARARSIHEDFAALLPQIDYRPETLVWNVAEGQVWAAHDGET